MPTAAEVQACGDATADQRADLRTLIDRMAVSDDWVQRFYDDVRAAGGLSRSAAQMAIRYLRRLDVKPGQPTHATPAQGDALRGLARTRTMPAQLAKLWLARFAAGELTWEQADLTIREWRRLPYREFVAADPTGPGFGAHAPDGYFALTGAADGRVRCYRIHTLSGAQRVVEQVNTRDGRRRRIPGWKGAQVLREVAADPAEAGRLYAATRMHCCDCNRPLHDTTQPGFAEAGVGPDCWSERQAAARAAATD